MRRNAPIWEGVTLERVRDGMLPSLRLPNLSPLTTMAHHAACLLALALLPAAALKPQPIPMPGPAPRAEEPPPLTARLPIAQRERYETFVQKCGRCHAPEKALGESYSAEEWDEYLKKKYRRAGAGITPRQVEQIGAFLRYWATAPR